MSEDTLPRVAATSFGDYSPRLVADAVNELRTLGRDEALARIRAVAAQAPPPPDATGLLWVMRVLFELPAGRGHPPVLLGTPSIPPPSAPEALPRFPIDLYADVPFLVVAGYELAGFPQGVEDHIAFYGEYGELRQSELRPAPADESLESGFLAHWQRAYGEAAAPDIRDLVRTQIRRLAAR